MAGIANDIIRQVALKHRFLPEKLTGHGKYRPLVHARQEAWFRILMETGYSYPRIGRITGGFDHTSVLYGVRQYARLMYGTAPKATLAEIRAAWEAQQLGVAA
jgi:chromosomal replication initiation ATPase DnaA